jgi:hypothetical protein
MLLWRAGKHRRRCRTFERQRCTLGPMITAVARGAVGFGSSGGGSWRSARVGGCQWCPHDVGSSEARAQEWRPLASSSRDDDGLP